MRERIAHIQAIVEDGSHNVAVEAVESQDDDASTLTIFSSGEHVYNGYMLLGDVSHPGDQLNRIRSIPKMSDFKDLLEPLYILFGVLRIISHRATSSWF